MNHWLILPILIPAIIAPLLVLAVRHDIVLARVFSVGSAVALLAVSIYHLSQTMDGDIETYALGNWAPPFGIILVLDRLAAAMLVVTALLGTSVIVYSLGNWDERGQHFHPLIQFQLMGLNGAFLTGDLFSLFVFFEVLLIASYGLMVHGGGPARIRAGVQYVVINLAGSTVFLFALALIYSVTGTMNIADLYLKAAKISDDDRALFDVGIIFLWIVFGLKSAIFPLHFWLPGTYSNTSGLIAALFAIMTKVGIYSILRIYPLSIACLSAGRYESAFEVLLVTAALITMLLGAIGVLGARGLGQQVSFSTLISMGFLAVAIIHPTESIRTAGLYYLVHSTFATAAMFMITDRITMSRNGNDRFTDGPAIENKAVIGTAFFIAAISIVGLPPLSGFIGKLLLMQGLTQTNAYPVLWTCMLLSSLIALVGFSRSGSLLFWKSGTVELETGQVATKSLQEVDRMTSIRQRIGPLSGIGLLVFALIAISAFASPALQFLREAVDQHLELSLYTDAVFATKGR